MTTGLAVFDTTLQETYEWLKMVEARLPPCDRQQAYAALRAVLQELREHLPTEAVFGLSAQLPMLLRGVFLEGWERVGPLQRGVEVFEQGIVDRLPPKFPRERSATIQAVLSVLAERIDDGEMRKILRQLPASLRRLCTAGCWPA